MLERLQKRNGQHKKNKMDPLELSIKSCMVKRRALNSNKNNYTKEIEELKGFI